MTAYIWFVSLYPLPILHIYYIILLTKSQYENYFQNGNMRYSGNLIRRWVVALALKKIAYGRSDRDKDRHRRHMGLRSDRVSGKSRQRTQACHFEKIFLLVLTNSKFGAYDPWSRRPKICTWHNFCTRGEVYKKNAQGNLGFSVTP